MFIGPFIGSSCCSAFYMYSTSRIIVWFIQIIVDVLLCLLQCMYFLSFFSLSYFMMCHPVYSDRFQRKWYRACSATVKPFLSLHRFIVLSLSFYRCKLPNLSFFFFIYRFYRFIVLSFFGKKHRVYSIVLSFYRCKENIEFFYRFNRFIVSSFYRCRPIVLSL